jgi:AcrR family transcriptional regulator
VGAAAAAGTARARRSARRCARHARPGGDPHLSQPIRSSPSPRRARARRGEGERLRAEILEAAARLLFESGDESAVSIRAVAEAVGVTPPSIYLHFADKDALMWEVCEEQFRKLDEAVAAATAGVEDPLEAIRRCGRAYVEFGLSNPQGYRVLFMGFGHDVPHSVDPDPGSKTPAAFAHVVETVRRGIQAGRFREERPELLALGLWAAAHGITSLLIALPGFPWPPDRQAMIDHIVAQAVEGVLAPA